MLRRKIINDLINWKKTKDKECLLVKGARQIGKTYIIDKFGKEYYTNYIYLNFLKNPNLKNIFEGSLEPQDIYRKMSIYINNLKLVPDTLIFLDEIQECPNARTALKFLAIDNMYDVIASGSLLGIKNKSISSIPVGYERHLMMYSLDFEEFLWATGLQEDAIDYLKKHFDSLSKIENGINDEMFRKLREYIVVGGMPDVVNTFINTNNFIDVQKTQEKLLSSYEDDITKYAETVEKPKIRKCYDSITKQLAKENRKFQYSVVEKKATSRKYADSIEWLIDANIVHAIYNVNNPVLPLEAYKMDDYFKIYLHDVGLLSAMYGFDLKEPILNNTLTGPIKGGIYENLICDMLIKRGYKLYYYKNSENSQELEFLITKNSKIIPVEVKAGNGPSISLNNFILKYNPPYAYKLVTGNIGVIDTKITLPLYMVMFV